MPERKVVQLVITSGEDFIRVSGSRSPNSVDLADGTVFYNKRAGMIIADKEVLATLNAMKGIDQSLPEFLKELAEGGKKK